MKNISYQLGICHYLIMDRDEGIRLMNEAIKDAEKAGDSAMAQMFKKEKNSWLGK
jgi:hypothetical protein